LTLLNILKKLLLKESVETIEQHLEISKETGDNVDPALEIPNETADNFEQGHASDNISTAKS
jgi:hypothetical protein